MPLIRYDTGDLVIPSDASCSCGRVFSVVKAIRGRLSHMLTTSSGRTVGLTALARLFKNVLLRLKALPIQDCQFVYDEAGDIRLEVIPAVPTVHELKRDIQGIMREDFPEDMNVAVILKTEFSRTSSGKTVSLARS
jgi:phenylacetate-coenzyme A ligase PaaK-like adenylate-forming protein